MKPITIPCDRHASHRGDREETGDVPGRDRGQRLLSLAVRSACVRTARSSWPIRLRLRAMIQRRAKTDKLDAQLLANLLRIDQIPLAYIPPEPYQQLRDLTRSRCSLGS